jgi:hypothetical protein
MIRHGDNLPAAAATRNNHIIRNGRFTLKVDNHQIFGQVIVQRRFYRVEKGFSFGFG